MNTAFGSLGAALMAASLCMLISPNPIAGAAIALLAPICTGWLIGNLLGWLIRKLLPRRA